MEKKITTVLESLCKPTGTGFIGFFSFDVLDIRGRDKFTCEKVWGVNHIHRQNDGYDRRQSWNRLNVWLLDYLLIDSVICGKTDWQEDIVLFLEGDMENWQKKKTTRGIMVTTSAFLTCRQCLNTGSSLGWSLNFRALVCGIFWSSSSGVSPDAPVSTPPSTVNGSANKLKLT